MGIPRRILLFDFYPHRVPVSVADREVRNGSPPIGVSLGKVLRLHFDLKGSILAEIRDERLVYNPLKVRSGISSAILPKIAFAEHFAHMH